MSLPTPKSLCCLAAPLASLLPGFTAPALSQDATALPEITVTAPSPIVRRKPAPQPRPPPARRPRRSAPRRRRAASPLGAAAGRAADRHRPVRHRHRGPERGDPPQRRRHARRSAEHQARHHRLQLRAGRLQPADHPRPRRQPRRHRRERHRQQRRLRSRRGSFRADRSARHQPGRSDPRPGDAALRLDRDRRRGQRHQQPHSRRAAALRRGAVPELRPAGEGAGRDRRRRAA